VAYLSSSRRLFELLLEVSVKGLERLAVEDEADGGLGGSVAHICTAHRVRH
jgi:hypothetical protein